MADNALDRAHALEVAAETHGKTQEPRSVSTGFGGLALSQPIAVTVPNDPAAVVAAAEQYARFLADGEPPADDEQRSFPSMIVEAEIAEPDDDRDATVVMVMQRKHEKLYTGTLNDLWRSAAEELALHHPELPEADHRRLAANIALRFQRDMAPF